MALVCLVAFGCGHRTLPEKEVILDEPYAEWRLEYADYSGNPYDVTASAIFTHEGSGTTKRSLMFYAGEDLRSGNTWRFRFTGTRPGTWSIETEGPGALGGRTGTVTVTETDSVRNGFVTTEGRHWIWSGTAEAFVPQYVMMNQPSAFLDGGTVDQDTIAQVVEEFVVETGFTGLHFSSGGGKWFDPGTILTTEVPHEPSPTSFEVLEEFVLRAYEAGGATHFWMWGADSHSEGGPAGIGGPMSVADRRLIRYIAGRLGPLPGWTIGYGYDLHAWAEESELQTWRDSLEAKLGGWSHPIGARADRYDADNEQMNELFETGGDLERRPVAAVFWTGDYAGHYDYRVAYPWYVEIFDWKAMPHLEEDRFRIRHRETFQFKDYTPDMTVRGLWHSTMAGGVANIWGNLLPHSENNRGSMPYDNGLTGKIRGVSFTVDVKDRIKTYDTFWFANDRFAADLIRANELTGNEPGSNVLSARDPTPIRVALRGPEHGRFVFYGEDTGRVRMDLSEASGPLEAVAVDTRRAYEEIDLGMLDPEVQRWKAPRTSDWAIAVGDFGD